MSSGCRRAARQRLRAGKIALLVIPPAPGARRRRRSPTASIRRAPRRGWRATPSTARCSAPPAVAIRARCKDDPVTEPGTRYIDFLIPGLIGMNLMSGSMWGIGWVIVNMRVRKLLKRLLATPMRRRDLLAGAGLARLLSLPLEVGAIVLFARLAFQRRRRGRLVALAVVSVAGRAVVRRQSRCWSPAAPRTPRPCRGLMNVVMMPMFVLSGVFFSAAHFPDVMQPLISILPLTALNDALRAVMIDGASLAAVARPLAILAGWGLSSFIVGVRIFRWA